MVRGKTPHVEYLVRLLKDLTKIAVLSRGYKRQTRGYLLADTDTTMRQIGDEPYQMKKKISRYFILPLTRSVPTEYNDLQPDSATNDVDVISA